MKIFRCLKGVINLIIVLTLFVPFISPTIAVTLAKRLSGRILLQVQAQGQAWYVNPVNLQRYYLGRPTDAFNIMRSLGLGISNADLTRIPEAGSTQAGDSVLRKRLSGRILLQVQAQGQAWYVNPVNLQRYYLGRPTDAFNIMRSLGLGISNADLAAIKAHPGEAVTAPPATTPPTAPSPAPPTSQRTIPAFIYAMRTNWPDAEFNDFQLNAIRDMSMRYVQGTPSFLWSSIESGPSGGIMKWNVTDAEMDMLSAKGLKVVPFINLPKLTGLHWNSSILRTDPRYRAEFGEFAYEVVNRYKNHPAWSGVAAVWGGSSDIWRDDTGAEISWNQPEVVIPLLNAAYDGIKRADPNTIVVGFNMGADVGATDWEQWHRRAFTLSPRFDWFGVQSHSNPVGVVPSDSPYRGVLGLTNVRSFLDQNGYNQKPVFLNEGGFHIFNSQFNEQSQAEQAVETYVVARAQNINLKGWMHFTLFGSAENPAGCGAVNDGDNWGIMSCYIKGSGVLPSPRPAYRALQTLFSTVNFADYNYEATLSGAPNQISPFVYRFAKASNASSKLWVIFSPRIGRSEPVSQDVSINIAPATRATRIDMLGNQTALQADGNGNVNVRSTSSPVYIRTGL